MLLEEREVLAGQLVLQGLGGGGHDRGALRQDRRHQVGERLAGAGAGLHGDVLALGDPEAHGVGHLALPARASPPPGQLADHPLQRIEHGIRHRTSTLPAGCDAAARWRSAGGAVGDDAAHVLPVEAHAHLALEGVLVPGVEEVGVHAVHATGGQLEPGRVARSPGSGPRR